MEWLWVVAIVAGTAIGFSLGAKSAAEGVKPEFHRLSRTQAADRNSLLRVLRRELANHLMQRNPAGFAKMYERLHYDVERYSNFSRDALLGEFRALVERYPMYEDFDLLGTRAHVLYPDAFGSYDDEDVVEHFRAIVRFQVLSAHLDADWSGVTATSQEDVRHAYEYSLKVRNAKFLARLKAAIDQFYLARGEDRDSFEAHNFSVVRVPHIPELRYGVHFKDTNEYGIYSVFHGEGLDKYESWFRSDLLFQEEERLALLPVVSYVEGE